MRLAAILLLAMLAACGGGGSGGAGLAPLAAEISLTRAGTIVPFAQTGRRPGDSTVELEFGLLFKDYFKCVRDGHVGVMLRADLARIPSQQYRGVGWVAGRFGNGGYTTRNLPNLRPLAVLETWAVGAVPDTFDSLILQSVSPELRDQTLYGMRLRSAPSAGTNTASYVMTSPAGLVMDTGRIVDVNPAVEMQQEAIAFFDATGTALCPYEVQIIQPTATWSADSGLPVLTPEPLDRYLTPTTPERPPT